MPYYEYKKDGTEVWRKEPRAACYASIYHNANKYHARLCYDANTKATNMHEESAVSAVNKETVTQYVSILKAAGFKFDFTQENGIVYDHGKADVSYVFSIKPDAQKLGMTKFWLNFVRYVANYPECIEASIKAVKECGGLSRLTKSDVFNILCVCSQVEHEDRNTNHNICPRYGAVIVPMTQAEFNGVCNTRADKYCYDMLKTIPNRTVKPRELITKKGYREYVKVIKNELKKAETEKEKAIKDLALLLGKG